MIVMENEKCYRKVKHMYSFDIFDTLLRRRTITPKGIFKLCQKKLSMEPERYGVLSDFANKFFYLRIKAEHIARGFSKEDEITLAEIYEELGVMTGYALEQLKAVMELEVETEKCCAAGITENISYLVSLCRKGERVILISDMYLSEMVIRDILLEINSVFRDIPIYVSSEYRKTKSSGLLYAEVRRKEGADYRNWTHIGDNEHSDGRIPELLGITTVYAQQPQMYGWEKEVFHDWSCSSRIDAELVLGTTALIKSNCRFSENELIGATFAGPVLFPYIQWLIRKSVQIGIKRLYFIARDGYILKKIADLYLEQCRLEIQTKYIYGSRRAWRVEDEGKRNNVKQYLMQEMDLSDDKAAFVDLHGTGLSMEYIADILNRNITVFYYDLVKKTSNPKCRFLSFTESGASNGVIELFCRAPHSATKGYKIENNVAVPEFESDGIDWGITGLEEYMQGVGIYIGQILVTMKKLDISIDGDEIGDELLAYAKTYTDSILNRFLGEIPFDESNQEEGKRYAPRVSQKDIFCMFFLEPYQYQKYYRGINLACSLGRLSDQERRQKEQYERLSKTLLAKMVRMFFLHTKSRSHMKRHMKIIIYGAGVVGKRLYYGIQGISGIRVVGWSDADYQKCQADHLPVKKLSDVLQTEYDAVVIAIKKSPDYVKELLVEAGVPARKIILLAAFEKMLKNGKRG